MKRSNLVLFVWEITSVQILLFPSVCFGRLHCSIRKYYSVSNHIEKCEISHLTQNCKNMITIPVQLTHQEIGMVCTFVPFLEINCLHYSIAYY